MSMSVVLAMLGAGVLSPPLVDDVDGVLLDDEDDRLSFL